MRDDPELLQLMLDDMERQQAVYQPGPYWQGYARRMAGAIRDEGLASFRSSVGIARGYGDVHLRDPLVYMQRGLKRSLVRSGLKLPGVRRVSDALYQMIQRYTDESQKYKNLYYDCAIGDWYEEFRGQHRLPGTLVGNPERRITLGGDEIGESYLWMFGAISDYSPRVDFSRVTTLLEIGGGFGAFAHSIMTMYPNIRNYILLDIPPLLYVGTQYLKHFYGEAVIDYRQTRGTEIRLDETGERRIVPIASWQIESLQAPVELLWNSSSFQEMPREVVRNYARHAERLLVPEADLCAFVYRQARADLDTEEVVAALTEDTSFVFEELPGPVTSVVFPGHCLLGRRPAAD